MCGCIYRFSLWCHLLDVTFSDQKSWMEFTQVCQAFTSPREETPGPGPAWAKPEVQTPWNAKQKLHPHCATGIYVMIIPLMFLSILRLLSRFHWVQFQHVWVLFTAYHVIPFHFIVFTQFTFFLNSISVHQERQRNNLASKESHLEEGWVDKDINLP